MNTRTHARTHARTHTHTHMHTPLAGGHAGVGKEFMRLCGLDLGPPRLPLLPLPLDQVKALESSLRDIGFFEWT